jgi:hypothetical protein
MKLIASICILLFTTLLGAPIRNEVPVDVSLIQVIANPETFDGKLVRVIGFLRLEFEGNALYFHREDYENGLLRNGIWVEATPEITRDRKTLNMNYVLLEGVFNAKDRGHMGMWSGSIRQIRRTEIWREGNHYLPAGGKAPD